MGLSCLNKTYEILDLTIFAQALRMEDLK